MKNDAVYQTGPDYSKQNFKLLIYYILLYSHF